MKKLSREMTLVLAGAVLVMVVPSVCAVMSVGVGMHVNDVQTQDLGKGEDPPPIVTLAEFEQIETGMSYREVVEILGEPGVAIAPSAVPEGGGGAIRYVWQNSDVSNMRATFQNDQLAKKSQLYLK
ncbi:MAG: DUF3862 domain-containing protein [Deltaproteobacteria bacterium]|nr:DUF3862 domain-containing protein [Deltaproteobacteria bacterium]MBW2359354.1 DUF3862 domain-containing protein [Deltaproteobacteria bacterium]